MAKTDLFDRAIPWSRLLRNQGAALPRTLNVGWGGRLSVLAALALLIALPLAVVLPLAAAGLALAAVLTTIAANRRFLGSLWREQEPGLAMAAVPLLTVHYLCAGLGYAWVLATPGRR